MVNGVEEDATVNVLLVSINHALWHLNELQAKMAEDKYTRTG